MQVSVIVADYAQAADGKLFISGAGWTHAVTGTNFAVAVLVTADAQVDAHDGPGRARDWCLTLEPGDGGTVGAPTFSGQFTFPDVALARVPMAFNISGLTLPPGRYRWQFLVDGFGDLGWGCDFVVRPAVAPVPAR